MKNIWQFLGLTQDAIGRGRYFVANITASFGLPIVVSLLMSFFFSLFEDEPVILYPLLALFIVSLVFALVVHIKTSIRRVRDIGIAQNWWVLAIIPLVNIPFIIFLCLKKGGSGGGHFSLWNNPFTKQFKRFFSHEFSKPFMIICFSVIVAGVVYAWFAASNVKNNIDLMIEQREEEIAQEMFGKSYEQARVEYDKRKSDHEKCLAGRTEPTEYARKSKCLSEMIYWETYEEKEQQAYKDSAYQELLYLKESSVSRVFIEKFVKNFGFGWWGVIALVSVFLINILIVFYKLIKMYVPLVFWYGNTQTKSIKTNMQGMAPFQRYSLALLTITVLALVVIAIAIIF